MAILVTAPTGHIGSKVVEGLLKAGDRPVLLVRNPDRLSEHIKQSSFVVTGDLSDPSTISQAAAQADTVFALIPTDYTSEDPIADMLEIGQNFANALEINKIKRVVMVSSEGAADADDSDFIGALGMIEGLLASAAENSVVLRPGYFYTNLQEDAETMKQGILPTTVPLDIAVPWNDPGDIGEFAARLLHNADWTGHEVIQLSGPRDLSYREIAALVSEIKGKPVEPIHSGEDEARHGMIQAGLTPGTAEGFLGMSRRVAKVFGTETNRSKVHRLPTSIETWISNSLVV